MSPAVRGASVVAAGWLFALALVGCAGNGCSDGATESNGDGGARDGTLVGADFSDDRDSADGDTDAPDGTAEPRFRWVRPYLDARAGEWAEYATSAGIESWSVVEAGAEPLIEISFPDNPFDEPERRRVDLADSAERPRWWQAERTAQHQPTTTQVSGKSIDVYAIVFEAYGNTGTTYEFTVSDQVPLDGVVRIVVTDSDRNERVLRELQDFGVAPGADGADTTDS